MSCNTNTKSTGRPSFMNIITMIHNHTHAYVHAYAHTHRRIHTQTHTHTHKHTHKQTQTQQQKNYYYYISFFFFICHPSITLDSMIRWSITKNKPNLQNLCTLDNYSYMIIWYHSSAGIETPSNTLLLLFLLLLSIFNWFIITL